MIVLGNSYCLGLFSWRLLRLEVGSLLFNQACESKPCEGERYVLPQEPLSWVLRTVGEGPSFSAGPEVAVVWGYGRLSTRGLRGCTSTVHAA